MRAVRRHRPRRSRIDESGTSLAELALISPVLVVLLVGMAQLGTIIYGLVTVDTAVREGARVASEQPNGSQAYTSGAPNGSPWTCVAGSTLNPACNAARASAGMLDGNAFAITVQAAGPSTTPSSPCPAGSVPDGYVSVSVAYDVPVFVPFLDQLLSSPGKRVRTISSTVVDRVEPCTITVGR